MGILGYDPDRRVVPRWRPFGRAINDWRSHDSEHSKGSVQQLVDELPAHAAWMESKNAHSASELVAEAFTRGGADEALAAAHEIIKSKDSSVSQKQLAQRLLGQREPEGNVPWGASPKNFIGKARSVLREFPSDPFLWMDLALAHCILGNDESARVAMETALHLAPGSTLIARSAARFFLHSDIDKGRAHQILLNPRLPLNPAVISAEIATATALGFSPKHHKRGLNLLQQDKYAPRLLSELAAAHSTLDYLAGNERRGKRWARAAGRNATENTVAQLAWICRQFGVTNVDILNPIGVRSPEADAWGNALEANWTDALSFSDSWYSDEPFSSRSLLFSSWIAATGIGDYNLGIKYARKGLDSDPSNRMLINNLAFCLASLNKVDDAVAAFAKLPGDPDSPAEWATMGLLEFRSGNAAEGEAKYNKAITLASRNSDPHAEAWAKLYLLREKVISTPEMKTQLLKQAAQVVSKAPKRYPGLNERILTEIYASPNSLDG